VGRGAPRGAVEPKGDPSWATGYTPFFMVCDAEAILPTNLNYEASRVMWYKDLEAK
jgi:hypothetical protein